MSSRVSLVVPDHGCGREVLGRVSLRVSFGWWASDRRCGWKVSWRMLLGLLLGVSMVALDPGMRWRCRGRCCGGCCPGCRWWCLLMYRSPLVTIHVGSESRHASIPQNSK